MAQKENDQTRHQKDINRKVNIASHLPYKNLWVQPLCRNSEGSFPIYVNLSLWVQLWQYVLNSEKNQGGIFLGRLCMNQENPFCEILSFVEVSFKSQEMKPLTGKRWRWSPPEDARQEQGATDQILGWFKTHSGHGPYLSRSDTILHKRFFNKEGQMAVVFDKLSKESGFFLLENDQITRNSNVLLYSSERNLLEERLAILVNSRSKNQDEKKDCEQAVPSRIPSEDWVSSTDSLLFIQLLNRSREQQRQTEKLSEPIEDQQPLSEGDPLLIEITEKVEEKDWPGQEPSPANFEDAETPIEVGQEQKECLNPVGKELPLEGEQSGQANLRTDGEVTAENMQQLKPSEEKAQTVERTLQIDNDLAFDSALAVVSTELSQRIHRLNNRLYKKE